MKGRKERQTERRVGGNGNVGHSGENDGIIEGRNDGRRKSRKVQYKEGRGQTKWRKRDNRNTKTK